MATGKRYYWIKLKENFMTSDTVDYLMGLPDGANYVVLYQMLILKTINTNGRLSRQIGDVIIPYDVEKIKRDCKWFTIDTVRVALNVFIQLGLIYHDVDGVLTMADYQNLVGSETDYSAQKRSQRKTELPPPNVDTPEDNVHEIVHTDIRDKSLEIRESDIRVSDIRGTEKEGDVGTAPQSTVVLTLTLNDKSEYPVTEKDVSEWSELYPSVDILQELRKMKGWCRDNPTRRKTKSGIRKFIGGWLAREQDKGGRLPRQPPLPPQQSGADRLAAMMKQGMFDE